MMTANNPPTENGTAEQLIAKVQLPACAVGLSLALEQASSVIVEGEQLVPNWNDQLPYLWVTDGDLTTFEDAVADDPTVTQLEPVTVLESGTLYRVAWAQQETGVQAWLRQAQIPILEADASGETQDWHLKLRLSTRDQLTDLQTYCEEHGFAFDLLRLYALDTPKLGQYNVSEKQREALLAAYEMGYFEIPRECKLSEIADKLGIAPRSVSERMRRGQTNLLTNTLLIGHTMTTDATT